MVNSVEQNFRENLQKLKIENKKVLLLVSGGVDSMTLLDLASKVLAAKNLAVLHINHNTRTQCEKEEQFICKLCANLKIQCFIEKLQKVPKNSRENFWRKERQKAVKKISRMSWRQCHGDFAFDVFFTAHHATDLVETMLFRLIKGCGVDGLAPFDLSTKPLWNISRKNILQYAEKNNLTWFEDETNQDNSISRNLIRNKILPEFRKITPNLEKVFVNNMEIFAKISDFLDSETPKQKEMKISDFLQLPEILQTTWLRNLAKNVPSHSELKDCEKWLKNNPKGSSTKTLGDTKLKIVKNQIIIS